MRKPYLKNQNKLVAVVEPQKIGDNTEILMPKFGLENLEEEDISHLYERELSIEEVYLGVLNQLKSNKQFSI
jgi:hypothetical protein